MTFDFCNGYPPDCAFKEYCPCLKFYNEYDASEMDDLSLNDRMLCLFEGSPDTSTIDNYFISPGLLIF